LSKNKPSLPNRPMMSSRALSTTPKSSQSHCKVPNVNAASTPFGCDMEPTSIYGLAASGMSLVMFLYCASAYISRWIQDRIYPNFVRPSRLSSPLSRWHALLLFIYWSGTVACNIVGVNTINQAGSRAGSLATLHLIPLLFTNRLSFAADSLGLSLHTYLNLYTSVGLMALVQSLIHTVIFLRSQPD